MYRFVILARLILLSIRREAIVLVEGIDALHLVVGEPEVEDVVVLSDMGGIGGAGDGDGAALSVYDRLVRELDSTKIYNDTIIYGYWFKPHEANAVNVFLHKDHTFEFRYYDNSQA